MKNRTASSKIRRFYVFLASMCFCFGGIQNLNFAENQEEKSKNQEIIIEDFQAEIASEKAKNKWEFISDRVMGGVSEGQIEIIEYENRACLHMTGDIYLKNNGGFIQARKSLRQKRKPFNASGFDGVYLKVKGMGDDYAVHIRTKNTWMPWQYYEAKFNTDQDWQYIRIPFEKFKPYYLKKPFDVTTLKTIALVAIGKEFRADIYLDEIGFYKEADKMEESAKNSKRKINNLTPEEERVIVRKGTEPPFSGKYNKHFEEGTYVCKRCGAELYKSSAKFASGCGWPAFEDEIEGAVRQQLDIDGRRTEIVCKNCGGHLGHVFFGEQLTPTNTRHCVNSVSMDFVAAGKEKTETAVFASGCFWGTEFHLQKAKGVKSTTVGYTGGALENPSYSRVSNGNTGHAEAVEVVFDPSKISYEELVKLYFETHDFTQLNRQGPDIGTQYRSVIFYADEKQKQTAEKYIKLLKSKGYEVKTSLEPIQRFWPAEKYHQDYYQKTGKRPYCHIYRKIF